VAYVRLLDFETYDAFEFFELYYYCSYCDDYFEGLELYASLPRIYTRSSVLFLALFDRFLLSLLITRLC